MNTLTNLFIAFSVALPTALFSDVIFDVSFEDPPHVNGSAPTYGVGSDRPTGISGPWTITNSFADSVSQVAAISSTATGGGLGFSPGGSYTTGVHLFSWDLAMLAPSQQSAIQILSLSGPAQALTVDYFGNGSIRVYDPLNGFQTVGAAPLDSFHSFAVSYDMYALQYDVMIDGLTVLDDRPMQGGAELYSVSIWNPFGESSIGVDNFRWEVVPEPSTLVLISLGILGVCGRLLAKPG